MTPKQKSEELFSNMYQVNETMGNYPMCFDTAKKCALVAANEILKQWEYIDTYLSDFGGKLNPTLKYWQQVKEELTNK